MNAIWVHAAISSDDGDAYDLVYLGEKLPAKRRTTWLLNPDPATTKTKEKKSTYLVKANFQVKSKFEYPILYLKVFGYEKGKNTRKAREQYKGGLAKFFFLGNGTVNAAQNNNVLQRSRSSFHWITRVWTIHYKVLLEIPASLPFSRYIHDDQGLSFRLFWRLEYSSHVDAIADYPTQKCSFQGNPSGSIPLVIVAEIDKNKADTEKLRRRHSEASWLRRQHENSYWRYDKGHCEASWMEQRSYHILVVGDSQPSYMCDHLHQFGTTPTDCVTIKGKWNEDEKRRPALVDFSLAYSDVIKKHLSMRKADNSTMVVLFNTQGLWEAAYGQLELFPTMLKKVLKALPSGNSLFYFFITTTAVHPHNYQPGIFQDSKKWAMTQPRVHAINEMAVSTLRQWSRIRVDSIDLEHISLLQEEDPMVPGDMRHYGNQTNELLLSYLLCEVDRLTTNAEY